MALSHNPKIVTDNLSFILDAGNPKCYSGSGTATSDAAKGASGTLVNGVGYSTDNGGVFTFTTASSQFISFTNTSDIELSTDASYTLSYWIYMNQTAVEAGIGFFAPMMKASFGNSYGHLIQGDPAGKVLVYAEEGSSVELSSTANLSTQKWHYVSCTVSTTSIDLYIDGQLDKSLTTGWTLTANTSPLYIGSNNGANYFLDGKMGVCTLHNRVLTAAEIVQNYEAHKGRFI